MVKFVYVLVGLVVLLLAGLVVIVLTVDLNAYRAEIAAELEAVTGRDVAIDGRIEFAMAPSFSVAVEDIRIGGNIGSQGRPLARLPRLQATIGIFPLLSGRIEVERIRLFDPVLVLERLPDGRANWQLAPPRGSTRGFSISVAELEIANGTVLIYGREVEHRIGALDVVASANSMTGPFEVSGTFAVNDERWTFTADVGRTDGRQFPVNLAMRSNAARLTAAGSLASGRQLDVFTGRLEAEGDSLGIALAVAGLPDHTLPGGLAALPFALETGIQAWPERLALSDATLLLGESRIQGRGEVAFGDPITAELALTAGRIDLDAIFAGPGLPEPSAADGFPGFGPALFPDIIVTAEVVADGLIYRGSAVRQVQIAAELAPGILSIRSASAQLPGGTDIALAGSVTEENGAIAFRGPVEVNADNLSATLTWLGEDLRDVPAARLRRVDLGASAVVEPGHVALKDIDLRFGSTRLTGAVAVRTGETTAVTADIAMDRINLDAYLPQPGALFAAGEAPPALPLPTDLDVALKAKAEKLTYGDLVVSGVVVDGILGGGRLELRHLGARDLLGASVRTEGMIDPDAGALDLRFGVESRDSGGLLRLLGLDRHIEATRLGVVRVIGEAAGGVAEMRLRQRLDTELGQFSIDGRLLEVTGPASFDGHIGLRAPSYRALAEALDMALPPAADSELVLAAEVTTDGMRADVDAALEILALKARASGAVEDLRGWSGIDLRWVAEHDRLGTLLSALGTGVGGEAGPARLDVTVRGGIDRMELLIAPSVLGPTTVHGTATVRALGARPRIDASLGVDVLTPALFLAAAASGTPPGNEPVDDGNDDARSREIPDIGVLAAFDGRFELIAEEARLAGLALSDANVVAALDRGTLTFERLEGAVFGGRLSLNDSVVEVEPLRIRLDLDLADADLAAVLSHVGAGGGATGELFLDAEVDAAGSSRRRLIESLTGRGTVAVRDGTVPGFDLRGLRDGLEGLDDEAGIADLVADVMAGAETRLLAAEGSFNVADGRVRSDDFGVLLDGGQADMIVDIDLPRRWIEFDGEIVLAGRPQAAPIPIALKGPMAAPVLDIDTRPLVEALLRDVAPARADAAGAEGAPSMPAAVEDGAGGEGTLGGPDDGEDEDGPRTDGVPDQPPVPMPKPVEERGGEGSPGAAAIAEATPAESAGEAVEFDEISDGLLQLLTEEEQEPAPRETETLNSDALMELLQTLDR